MKQALRSMSAARAQFSTMKGGDGDPFQPH
jgi:hypothetical protein